MKPFLHTALAATSLLALAAASCTGLWDADVSADSGAYYYDDSPFYNAPYYSGTLYPYYWGYDYTTPVWPVNRVPRPGGPAWSTPAPLPGGGANRPGGNIRPGNGTVNRPVTLPENNGRPVESIPPHRVTGGEPGIAMPPAGTGYRPSQGRH